MHSKQLERTRRASGTFADDGYGVVRGVVGDDVLRAARAEAERALRAPAVEGCERPHNRLVPLRWNDALVDLLLSRSRAAGAVADVTRADDPRWISGYLSVKEPRSPALWWHQDWWCWNHPVSLRAAAPQVALLLYLSDTSERSGALRVLPGSHRRSVPLHAVLPEAHRRGEGLPLDHPALDDQPEQVTVPVRAGDGVVLDYRLLHGTHPNASADRRDCVLLSFTPSWRTLPTDVRAHLIQHLALPGDDERAPPTAWRRKLLPSFDGARADLPLRRDAPARFGARE